jgi:hypothetical protein
MIIIKEALELKRQITILAAAVLLLSMVGLSAWAAEDPAVLKTISYQKLDKGLEATILLEGPFIYQAFTLTNPNRLAIDISPVEKIEAELYYEVNAMGLTSLRTGEFAPQIVRVVFDFTDQILAYEIKKFEGGIVVRLSTEELKAAVEVKEAPQVAAKIKAKPAGRVREEVPEVQKEGFYNTMIGLSVASYQIPDTNYGEVYGPEAAPIYGLNLSRTLISLGNFQFDISAEARLYKKTGAATVSLEEAKFTMFPIISIAPRLLFQTKYALLFAGGGPDFYSYKEESVLATTTGSKTGYHFQAGVYIIPPTIDFLRVKLYYKFTKVKAVENGYEVELGGNEYGVGLCFGFNFLNGALINK